MVHTKTSGKRTQWQTLVDFALANPMIAYQDELKAKFKRIGNAGLRNLCIYLAATDRVHNLKISYNPGGIAVSGDFHLKGDFKDGGSFDLFFNLDGFSRAICYRKTESQKDYRGEENRFFHWERAGDIAHIVDRILLLETRRKIESLPQGAI